MTPSRPSPRGFALIEVMLAMAIGMVVIGLAVTLLSRSGSDYERIGGGVAAEREARAVLSQLSADLQSAHFHPDQIMEKTAAAWPRDRLGLLTLQAPAAQAPASQIGDLCAVHYYLKDLLIGGRTTRCLMRGFRDSKDTFAALAKSEVSTLFTPTDRDEPVAFCVLGFHARPQTRAADGTWQDWVKSTTLPPDEPDPPATLDLRLTIVRRELAGRLTTPAAWDGGGTGPQAITKANLEVYSTRIRFGNPTPGAPNPSSASQ
jgi:type II secretory pathway pseudopilin PulG